MPSHTAAPPGWPGRLRESDPSLLLLMLERRMSRKKARSGKPSLPCGLPAPGHVRRRRTPLTCAAKGMSEREDTVLMRIFAVRGDVARGRRRNCRPNIAEHIQLAPIARAVADAGLPADLRGRRNRRRRMKFTTPAMRVRTVDRRIAAGRRCRRARSDRSGWC